MADFKIPKELKDRLETVAKNNKFASGEALAQHFIERGLKAYEMPDGPVKKQLAYLVDEQGYSSPEEAVEHLLIRGLKAYEESAATPEELEARLRGLGYID
jgi:hypothetical protein